MAGRNRIRIAKLFPINAGIAVLLAVFICASVTWPIQEYAQQPIPAETASAPAASTPAASLLNLSSTPKTDFTMLASNYRPGNDIAGLGAYSHAATLPAFNVPKLADSPDGGVAVASTTTEGRHIRKGYLVLGILGVGAAVAGGAALALSGDVHGKSSVANTVHGDLHTTGMVMIPAGAAVAALGFIFAFRHNK